MKYIEPDFYADFKCKADKCRHSCCIGWEIDVDEASMRRYSRVKGALGEKLARSISSEGEPHFILGEGERCPFLMESGLCELICSLGEESLSDICSEHPRFYNYYASREERGLGLCCEEAVRLLLSSDETFTLNEESDGQDEPEENKLILRDNILLILSDRSCSFEERLEDSLGICGAEIFELNIPFWRDFYLSLERMEDSWTERLIKLPKGRIDIESVRCEKLCSYFVYRHFVSLSDSYGPATAMLFAALSTAIIAAADTFYGVDDENIRLYSSEIEYSDENIALIAEKLAERQQ